MEMEALRLQNEELKAEVGRLKETRAAFYQMYIESQGKTSSNAFFTRHRVFEALQLSADADRDKKEPAPKSSRKPKAKPDEVAPAEEVKAEPDEVKVEPEVEASLELHAEINLDDALYPQGYDWSFDKPNVPFKTVYIIRKDDSES